MKILSSDYIEEINVNELDYEYVNGDITMCEMSPNETKFLLYLLKTKDPKKLWKLVYLLEVLHIIF